MKGNKRLSPNTGLSILLLAVCVSMLLLGVSLVRTKLLKNTQELGMALAESYASEEELHVTTYSNFLMLGAQYVEELEGAGASEEEIQAELARRTAAWKPREPKYKTGALGLFTQNAASPMKGGYMD